LKKILPFIIATLALVSCGVEPSDTETAKTGIAIASPITSYLSAVDGDTYPTTLAQIMGELDLEAISLEQSSAPSAPPSFYFIGQRDQKVFLAYRLIEDAVPSSYSLSFRFFENGTNFCNWRTDRQSWQCFGV